eukprot:300407_1
MFRVNKPISTLLRRATSSLSKPTMLPVLSIRTAVGGTKGAPPISIDDLYGLCFLSEPTVRPPVEREPQAMFDCDMRINEVVCYFNGGLHATNDQVSESFARHMFESSVIFFPRNAADKPAEFREILKSKGGTDELPQLWINAKLVASGQELGDFDRVFELCAPARRPWPRDGSYSKGFYNRPGVTQSDQVIGQP